MEGPPRMPLEAGPAIWLHADPARFVGATAPVRVQVLRGPTNRPVGSFALRDELPDPAGGRVYFELDGTSWPRGGRGLVVRTADGWRVEDPLAR